LSVRSKKTSDLGDTAVEVVEAFDQIAHE
jgi:hypothetical protein